MADIGAVIDYPLPVINTLGNLGLGAQFSTINNNALVANVWPSSNLALFVPITIGAIYTIQQFFWANGVTVGTNSVDAGLYDSQQNLIVHTTNTLTSGASSVQGVSVTPTTIEPGLYYLAMSMNGVTDTTYRQILSIVGNAGVGMYSQASANPLPSTATFAQTTVSQIPLIGMSSNTLL